jgi:hypothetical protein
MKSRQTDLADPAVVAFYRATLDCQLVRKVLHDDQQGALRNAVNGLAFAIQSIAEGLIEIQENRCKRRVPRNRRKSDARR